MRESQKAADPTSDTAVVVLDETTPLKPATTSSEDSNESKERLRRWAIILCLGSVGLNFVLSLAGYVIAAIRSSPATYAFASDCLLDLASSVIVIWRYYGSAYTVYSETREQTACVGLGIFFVVAALGIIAEAIVNLSLYEYPTWSLHLLVMSGVGLFCCLLMAVAKFYLSKLMGSESLFLDGLNSVLSGLFALVIIISDVVHHFNSAIWYLDPILSMIVSVFMIIFGFRIIRQHSRPDDPCLCC